MAAKANDGSPMIVSTPLMATAEALRSGRLDLLTLVDEVCKRLDAYEPAIHAFVPGHGKSKRKNTSLCW